MFSSEEEEKFWTNRDKFPHDLRKTLEDYFEIRHFYFDEQPALEEKMNSVLLPLIKKQFPLVYSSNEALVQKYMHDINRMYGYYISCKIFILLRYQKQGINFKEKYPKLEEWRLFYWRSSGAEVVEDSERNLLLHKSDGEWEEYKRKENRRIVLFHQWTENRKQEFYDLVQPVLFEFFPELHNLEGDAWVMYAVHLWDCYDNIWKGFCEILETIIEYNLPVESFYWENEVRGKLLRETMKDDKLLKTVESNRHKFIYGAEYEDLKDD